MALSVMRFTTVAVETDNGERDDGKLRTWIPAARSRARQLQSSGSLPTNFLAFVAIECRPWPTQRRAA
jgi:hypothetical protein